MRLLWSLPKAAPAILRHLVGYAELAVLDLERTQRDFSARLIASLVFALCVFFLLLSICLGIVALTWDTRYRVSAIVWMGAVFFAVALLAGLYRSKVIGAQTKFLGSVRREWAEDRVLLDKILSDQDS